MNKEKNMVTAIKKGEQRGFNRLYQFKSPIAKWLMAHGCPKREVEDVFQESLLIFCKNCKRSEFELTSSIQTYLIGIAKRIWWTKSRELSKYPLIDSMDHYVEEFFQTHEEEQARLKTIQLVFNKLSNRCKEIIKLFYVQAIDMSEIAEILGFKSADVAKNQKYKCMRKARSIANNIPS